MGFNDRQDFKNPLLFAYLLSSILSFGKHQSFYKLISRIGIFVQNSEEIVITTSNTSVIRSIAEKSFDGKGDSHFKSKLMRLVQRCEKLSYRNLTLLKYFVKLNEFHKQEATFDVNRKLNGCFDLTEKIIFRPIVRVNSHDFKQFREINSISKLISRKFYSTEYGVSFSLDHCAQVI